MEGSDCIHISAGEADGGVEVGFRISADAAAGQVGKGLNPELRVAVDFRCGCDGIAGDVEMDFLAARGERDLGADEFPLMILRGYDRFDRDDHCAPLVIHMESQIAQRDFFEYDRRGFRRLRRFRRFGGGGALRREFRNARKYALEIEAGNGEFPLFYRETDVASREREIGDLQRARSAERQVRRVVRPDRIK